MVSTLNGRKAGAAVEQLKAEWSAEYRRRTPRSLRADQRARQFIAATQRTRFSSGMPYPIYIQHGQGAWFTDIDGNEFLDCNAAWNASLFGRGNEQIAAAAMTEMTSVGAPGGAMHPSLLRDQFSEAICERIPGAERVVFAPSGSEANSYALRLARAATGRARVLRIAGGFHGQNDYLLGRGSSRLGLPEAVDQATIDVPFNDATAALAALHEHARDLAAVFVEPMMTIPGALHQRDGFIATLRAGAAEVGVPFVLDEVITGSRFAVGGASEHLGLGHPPDLVVMGKMLGGGFPLAVVVGNETLLEQGISASNTYAQNSVSMAAALATFELSTPEVYKRLQSQGSRLREALRVAVAGLELPVQITGDGPCAGIHFTAEDVVDADVAARADHDLWSLMCLGVTNQGLGISSRTFGPIAPFGDREIGFMIEAFAHVLERVSHAWASDV